MLSLVACRAAGSFMNCPQKVESPLMSNQTNFYRERAAEARGRADQTDLSNVKESHIRSATAWEMLATRSEKSDRLREAEIVRKAETGLAVGY